MRISDMTVSTIRFEPKKKATEQTISQTTSARIKRLTVMLTEICNLDCWMCDFRVSKKLTRVLPYSPEAFVQLLDHPVFRDSLRTLTFTGGEPFAHPQLPSMYAAIRDAYPDLRCNFSTNCTLLPKMLPVFDSVKNWKKAGMLVSIDGIDRHDQQRGKEGAFSKTFANLEAIRERYPQLSITLKFTITPVNYDELQKTYEFFNSRGYRFTVKMLEHNPFYTNRLSQDAPESGYDFTPEQLLSIEKQIREIVANAPRGRNLLRIQEMEEVLESLEHDWQRSGRCAVPTDIAFLDANLDFFTCKEYRPILNLARDSLDELDSHPNYKMVQELERCNGGKCTRCTSQMKRTSEVKRWIGYLASFLR